MELAEAWHRFDPSETAEDWLDTIDLETDQVDSDMAWLTAPRRPA